MELALKIEADLAPRSIEGLSDASWVLLDYGELVVHVFLAETRAFYDLERLWSDAPRIALGAGASQRRLSATQRRSSTHGRRCTPRSAEAGLQLPDPDVPLEAG